MKQEIVSREMKIEGAGRTKRIITIRTLKCGHVQVEPHGGKANRAFFAQCKECDKLLINNKALMAGPGVTTLDPAD